MPTPFSFFDYASNPNHPATLEVWLSTSPPPATDRLNLAHYTEADFPGYTRRSGPRSSLFRPPLVGTYHTLLETLRLTWENHDADPITIQSVLVIARLPGEDPRLVAVFEANQTLSTANPGISVNLQFSTSRITP